MAESTLNLGYVQLRGEIGAFLGYGRGADLSEATWTTPQTNNINSIIQSGYHRVLFPALPSGEKYSWSFIKPYYNASLSSGASTITLPDDFGGIEGEISITSPTTSGWWPVPVIGEGQVQQMFAAMPTSTGRPRYAAIQPIKGTTLTTGARYNLYVFPAADQAYTLRVRYNVLPDALTSALPYAYGGMWMRELMLESCLAVAEERQDDRAGVHGQAYNRMLVAAVDADRKLKSQTLGQNSDRSDELGYQRGRGYLERAVLTINGVDY